MTNNIYKSNKIGLYLFIHNETGLTYYAACDQYTHLSTCGKYSLKSLFKEIINTNGAISDNILFSFMSNKINFITLLLAEYFSSVEEMFEKYIEEFL